MIKRLDEIVGSNWPVRAVKDRVSAAVKNAAAHPVGRELQLLADSVARQWKVYSGSYTLDEVFRDPRGFRDTAISDMQAFLVERSYDFDMRFSIERFAKTVDELFNLSFVGIYTKTDVVDMSVEKDKNTGQFLPDRWAHYHDVFADMQAPQVLVGDECFTLVVPLLYRGEKLGAALYDRNHFSKRDVASLVYCTSLFSRHIKNCKTGYKWRKDALTDILTDLPNRRSFMHSCTRMIRKAQKEGTPLSLLLLDLDHFKRINDELGHEEGDNVLRSVATVLRDNFRGRDMMRYGGEEFVVAVEAPYDIAHQRAKACLIDINKIPHMTKISATFGVAAIDRDVEGDSNNVGAEDLLDYLVKTADKRMYAAKPFRNTVYCIDRDALTGFPNMMTFGAELKKYLDPKRRESKTVAVYLLNVKGMTGVIRNLGDIPSWNLFRDSVQALNGKHSEFEIIARVHTRDEVIAYFCFDNGFDDYHALAGEKARRALDILRQPRNGNFFNPLNFVMGVTLYNPSWVDREQAAEIEENPHLLFAFAQQMVDQAKISADGLAMSNYSR